MKEDHVERSLSMNALQYAASHLLYVAGIRKQDIAFDGLTALAGGISVRFCAPRENAAGDILSFAEFSGQEAGICREKWRLPG